MPTFSLKFESFSATPAAAGLGCAALAFLIWGLSPLYWKLIASVAPGEIILHRIVWSLAVLLPLVMLSGRGGDFRQALAQPRTLALLGATSLLVAANWLIYIWAVNSGHVLEASLGYYINPLINVLLGVAFLGERLRRMQRWAVALAALGVAVQTAQYGRVPWISLALALSFGIYGLARKMAAVGALVGLTVETLLLAVPSLAVLIYLEAIGRGTFLHAGRQIDLLLCGSAMVTALPLLLFNLGARRLHLATIGLLQYIAPSCMFLLAVWRYQEPVGTMRWLTFVLIWAGLALYSADAVAAGRGRTASSGPQASARH
jgi:chloramphenicol-sensitive protein RarD